MAEVITRIPGLWPLGLALGAFGALVLLGRKRIGALYDRVDMPEEDRERFKRVVVPLLGWTFVAFGGLILIGAAAGHFWPESVRQLLQSNDLERLFAWGFVLLGVGNVVSHVTGWPRPMKLGAMMNTYGAVSGRILHLLAYSAMPVGLGVWMLLR